VPPPPAPHILALTIKLTDGVIVQVPAVDKLSAPFTARSQTLSPDTAGLIETFWPAGGHAELATADADSVELKNPDAELIVVVIWAALMTPPL
jgi:hypothetical protein